MQALCTNLAVVFEQHFGLARPVRPLVFCFRVARRQRKVRLHSRAARPMHAREARRRHCTLRQTLSACAEAFRALNPRDNPSDISTLYPHFQIATPSLRGRAAPCSQNPGVLAGLPHQRQASHRRRSLTWLASQRRRLDTKSVQIVDTPPLSHSLHAQRSPCACWHALSRGDCRAA